MDVLVLAGGTSAELPVPEKAQINIGGRRMVDHVVAALQAVPAVRSVRVHRGRERSLVANLLDAVEAMIAEGSEYVLISACDIPFLTPEAVEDFLANCPPECDFCYPIVRREACERKFPGVRRTYVKLKEGTFTGGNLFLVRAEALPPLRERLTRIFRYRKRPLLLAREFGWGVTLSFAVSALLRTLSVQKLERELWRLIGIRAKAVITEHAEIGTDIDKLSDLRQLEQLVINTKEVI